jgi:hypothetical protein
MGDGEMSQKLNVCLSVLLAIILAGCGSTAIMSPSSPVLPSITPKPAASQALSEFVSPGISPSDMPVNSITPDPTDSSEETQPPDIAINEVKKMYISELFAKMGDKYYSDSGDIKIVTRSKCIYYNWYNDELLLYDGSTNTKILDNACCNWMYIDENQNLWFGIDGDIGIFSKSVQQWEYVYEYNIQIDKFILRLKENQNRCIVSMYKSYLIYTENKVLKAFDTLNNSITKIGGINGNLVYVMDNQKDIYYQDNLNKTILLSDFGGVNQSKTLLNLNNFPNRVFSCSDYIIDDDNQALYKFRRTGYEKVCNLDDNSNWSFSDGCAPFIVGTEEGIYFPNSTGAYIDYFDIKTKTWSTFGDPNQTTLTWPYDVDGQFWFTTWQPAALCRISNGIYVKYDLSKAIDECNWRGYYNNIVFLSSDENDDDYSYVFFPETKELYDIIPMPSPKDEEEGA